MITVREFRDYHVKMSATKIISTDQNINNVEDKNISKSNYSDVVIS